MKKIKFFYGLSGTFKTATITAEKENYLNPPVVWSMIKLWKDLENGVFYGKIEPNHLNFALLHMCCLGKELKSQEGKEDAVILSERGVSDPLFYYRNGEEENWFDNVVKKEIELCRNYEIEKVLLIQKDEKFIDEVVLKEPHRRAIFPSVSEYLKKQEEYIRFTEKYNSITKKIEITNAEDYIKSLGMEFKTN